MLGNSQKNGKYSSPRSEILNISPFGIWLFFEEKEYFMQYKDFPWFRNATVNQICHYEVSPTGNFYWPELDVDLAIEQIASPEKWPLVSRS